MKDTKHDETKYVRSKESVEMDVRSAQKKLEEVGILSSESFTLYEIDALVEAISQ
jgi:hypothetical protein